MRLAGKVAIVTGAGRGLGRAYALRLADLGADVVAVDRDLASAAEFGEALTAASVHDEIVARGVGSIEIEADLTTRSGADTVVERTMGAFGRIDILVNNAGGMLTPMDRSAPSSTPAGDLDLLFGVNFMTMLHCCQAVAPVMKSQHSGVVVNTSSVAARDVLQDGLVAVYGAAKAAVERYTRSLAAELGPFGVRANCIAPGIVMTARVAAQAAQRGTDAAEGAARIPLRRFGEPEDCAGVIEFLTTDLSRYVTGQCISVCGGTVLAAS